MSKCVLIGAEPFKKAGIKHAYETFINSKLPKLIKRIDLPDK